ncbi:hypothetical protein AB3N59_14440 [Leptospira sp. WS92.C1]
MKLLLILSSGLNILFLGILCVSIFLLHKSMRLNDSVAYEKKSSVKTITYQILQRPKSVFGGYKYYFGVKMGKEVAPFVQKYWPVLDSDKNKFDRIEELFECGEDTYVVTLRKGQAFRYLQFSVLDRGSRLVEERVLRQCARGQE